MNEQTKKQQWVDGELGREEWINGQMGINSTSKKLIPDLKKDKLDLCLNLHSLNQIKVEFANFWFKKVEGKLGCPMRKKMPQEAKGIIKDAIALIHKWRSIYNSFVKVQISLPSLDTIQ